MLAALNGWTWAQTCFELNTNISLLKCSQCQQFDVQQAGKCSLVSLYLESEKKKQSCKSKLLCRPGEEIMNWQSVKCTVWETAQQRQILQRLLNKSVVNVRGGEVETEIYSLSAGNRPNWNSVIVRGSFSLEEIRWKVNYPNGRETDDCNMWCVKEILSKWMCAYSIFPIF